MRSLIFALQFLTRLPLPAQADPGPDALAASAKWFPLAGLIIGGLLAICLSAGGTINPWLGALLAIACWIWVTGGIHLDGLSDLADALGGAHRDPAQFLRIMRDPHAGVFGIITLWLVLTAKLVLLMLLLSTPSALWTALLIPAWARLGPVIWAQTLPPLGAGLGQRFGQQAQPLVWGIWLLALAALSWQFAWPLLGAPLALLLWWLFLKFRVKGMNGDCLGAGVEVTEVLLLALMVALAAVQ
jgi:adenosylcobinamide-GDP ribazoletransferase